MHCCAAALTATRAGAYAGTQEEVDALLRGRPHSHTRRRVCGHAGGSRCTAAGARRLARLRPRGSAALHATICAVCVLIAPRPALELLRIAMLFAVTAVAEIVGCYLPWLVLRQGKPVWLLLPAAASLALFAWLLTLHPTAAGRTYAAYGGMYIAVALVWLRLVDGVTLTRWDIGGAAIALTGMAVIALQPQAN